MAIRFESPSPSLAMGESWAFIAQWVNADSAINALKNQNLIAHKFSMLYGAINPA
jgi:hypothetical protein